MPLCQSLKGVGAGGECCKSVVLSVSLALEESGALVMCAFSLSCEIILMFKAHLPMNATHSPQARAREYVGEGGGGGLTLNSLSRTWLNLKQPLSFRAFKQLECMAKSRVSF